MLMSFALFFGVAVVVAASTKTYDNYKVFKITPTTDEQLDYLRNLDRENNDYQFWTELRRKNQVASILVPPRKLEEFYFLMNVTQINYGVQIENVQTLIDKENPPVSREDSNVFNWTKYHTYEEINAWLESLATKYSEVEVLVGGRTYEGRDIKGVKLSYGDREKPGIFIEGGIHANEWIGPATVTYLLNEFLTSDDLNVRKLARAYDWYMFPIFNPDGYVYTFKEDRLWRKTRVPNGNGCFGVDPNRNWDYQWMSGGASDDPCDRTYAGKSPFSEAETRTISKYISSISKKLFAFVSFHSFGQHLLLPYGHTKEHLDNYDELYLIGRKTINRLAKRYGTKFDVGNIPEVLYIDSGSSMDWVKGILKLPITYTYELRDEGQYGFLLPAKSIIPTGEEVLDSFLTLFQEASKIGYPKKNL